MKVVVGVLTACILLAAVIVGTGDDSTDNAISSAQSEAINDQEGEGEAHIVLVEARSRCQLYRGFQHVWVIVGLRNTGDVDGEVIVLPWRRLSKDLIGYPGNVWDENPTPASHTLTVKVPAHTMKKVKTRFGFATEGKHVHLERCGVILGNDLNDLEHYGNNLHFLRIAPLARAA